VASGGSLAPGVGEGPLEFLAGEVVLEKRNGRGQVRAWAQKGVLELVARRVVAAGDEVRLKGFKLGAGV